MDQDNKKLTASQAVNELRRMFKVFESFKSLEEVLSVVAEKEQYLNSLRETTTSLEEYRSELHSKLDELEIKLRVEAQKNKEVANKAEELLKKAQDSYKELVSKGAVEAEELVRTAQKEILSLQNKRDALTKEIELLNAEVGKSSVELKDLRDNIQREKEALLSKFK